MPSVSITDPRPTKPFPDPITGTYDLAAAVAAEAEKADFGFSITVSVNRPGKPPATFAATTAGGTAGTWSCDKPAGLDTGVDDYEITADLDFNGDPAQDFVDEISN